jgi:hypothetical protein
MYYPLCSSTCAFSAIHLAIYREQCMESKFAVTALVIVMLASSAMVHAQQSIRLTTPDAVSTVTKPDAYVVPSIGNSKSDEWKGQQRFVEQPNRFGKMFQDQAAEAGDPRRVPMYLLIPFARGRSQSTTVGPSLPANNSVPLPNVVKDVGALVASLRTNG